MATWSTLIALLSMHLAMNYAAVTAVSMRTLSRQRLNIVVSHYQSAPGSGIALRPADVSKQERVFERDGVLRWSDKCIIGHCNIGVSMDRLLRSMNVGKSERNRRTGSLELDMRTIKLSELMRVYAEEAYILWATNSPMGCEVAIVLKQGCTPIDQLKAWSHALLFAQRARWSREGKREAVERKQHESEKNDASGPSGRDLLLADLKATLKETKSMFEDENLLESLREMGWDLDIAALETSAGTRIAVSSKM